MEFTTLMTQAAATLGATVAGTPFASQAAILCPVEFAGRTCMLKVTSQTEEIQGIAALAQWDSIASVKVLAHGPVTDTHWGAIMPFATCNATPSDRDLAATVAQLHLDLSAQSSSPSGSVGPVDLVGSVDLVGPVDLAGLIDLSVWFSSLLSMTTTPPELPAWAATTLNRAQDTANRLLAATPADSGPLHGDVHHSNLLNFTTTAGGPGQWKFIDPKGLTGDRTFDYVNIVFNPDLGHSANEALFTRRVAGIGKQAHLDHAHYVRWILAYGGLSALWHLEDSSPEQALATLKVARLAQSQLGL